MMRTLDYGIFQLEISSDGKRATMNFNTSNPKYPEDLVESSFLREMKYTQKLSYYPWGPKNVHVRQDLKKISFDWNGDSLETAELPADWKTQLEKIVREITRERLYKPNFYPKCFYVDELGKIHAFAFYSTSSREEQPIAMGFYAPILNEDRQALVDELSVGGALDMGTLIKFAYTDYIKWPEDALVEIYNKVFG